MLYTTNIINREQNDIDNIAEIIKKSIYSEIKQNNYNYIAKNILDYLRKKREHEHTIPKIGEYWHFRGSKFVYQRININGLVSPQDKVFFSINITSSTTDYTEKTKDGIEILELVSFEDGVFTFRPKY